MPIKRVKFDSFTFRDRSNIKREIKGLSLPSRLRFLDLLDVINELTEEHADCDLRTLYDWDQEFQEAVNECLALFGIEPDWISASVLIQLLFSYEGGKGLLMQLEFPDNPRDKGLTGESTEDSDPYGVAVASVWSFMPDKSLSEVRAIVHEWSWNQLQAVLVERSRQIEEANPELKKKKQQEQDLRDCAQEFEKVVKDGSLFSPPDPARVREGLRQAMAGTIE